MTRDIVYLDNAATSWPKPASVNRAMAAFLEHDAGSPNRGGHRLAAAAGHVVHACRAKLARLIGAPDHRCVIHCLNCTDALNIAIKGVLEEGDHVVCTSLDHNSIARPLEAMRRCGFISVTRVACGADSCVDPDELRAAITPATKLVILVHASNVTGTIQPAEAVGAMVREHDLLFLLDAAQTIGTVPIDVDALAVDLLAFPGHKSLLGPPGTGGLYAGPRARLKSFREGGTGADSIHPTQPEEMPTWLEAGTPNGVGLAGLSAALDDVDPATTLAHERDMLQRLIDRLTETPDVTLYRAPTVDQSVGCLAMNLAAQAPEELATILDQSFRIAVRPGLHCAPYMHEALGTSPDGSVRISPGPTTTAEEIDALVDALCDVRSA